MKVLTDFDGTWTDPWEEVREVRTALVEALVADRGFAPAGAERFVADLEREAAERPGTVGWLSNGDVSVWLDEDPLAIARVAASRLGADDAWGGSIFLRGYRRARGGGLAAPSAGAREALAALLGAGCDVVFVSNSPAAKVRATVEALVVPGPAGRPLGVVGDAAKFVLAPPAAGFPDPVAFDGVRVRTHRPAYLEILEAERPDVVVGDIVSLDLALPRALGIRTILRRRPYAPRWAVESGLETFVDLADLPRLLLG